MNIKEIINFFKKHPNPKVWGRYARGKLGNDSFWASPKAFMLLASLVVALWLFNWAFAPWLYGGVIKAGPAGDTFGGLTALFSGLAFAGLIITLFMQKQELKQQREELSQTREVFSVQRFENTFFGMLNLLNRQVQSISYTRRGHEEKQGKDALEGMASLLKGDYRYIFSRDTRAPNYDTDSKTPMNSRHTYINERFFDINEISKEYQQAYDENFETDLGPYFRIIYNIIKLIDRTEFYAKEPKDTQDIRQGYADLLRAHLSSSEVKLLMFNCVSTHGGKLKPFVEKYGLLKHLTDDHKEKHTVVIGEYAKSAFEN